jgi:hypothetical protein
MIATASKRFAKLQQPITFSPDLAAQFLLATAFVSAGIVVAPAGTLGWYLQRRAR